MTTMLRTMSLFTTFKIMTLNHTLKSSANRDALNINKIAGFKIINSNLLPDAEPFNFISSNLANKFQRWNFSFFEMSKLGLITRFSVAASKPSCTAV